MGAQVVAVADAGPATHSRHGLLAASVCHAAHVASVEDLSKQAAMRRSSSSPVHSPAKGPTGGCHVGVKVDTLAGEQVLAASSGPTLTSPLSTEESTLTVPE